jgi:predicted secreted protein
METSCDQPTAGSSETGTPVGGGGPPEWQAVVAQRGTKMLELMVE